MKIQPFFDKDTATVTYVISDPQTKRCAIIDPVLDYNPSSGTTATTSADRVIDYIKTSSLTVEWLLETHIHADHLTATSYLKGKLGGKSGVGEKIVDVLSYWVPVFNTAHDTPADGSQFDRLFKNGDRFNIGNIPATVMHTPGHTPSCISYHISDAIFVGDTLFMPYMGTARADFPGGDAATLYRSIQKILSLPDNTRIFTCHDYPPEGQPAAWESTVAQQKKDNTLINAQISEGEYIEKRKARDSKLPVPRLLLPALQVNMRAGKFGEPETNGTQYIKIPLNKLPS